ncbi:membrane integrity-associated transporter subunit PqiC [Achromobacter sp. GG226]|uniref:PqiC family protein n=1 Tax=Verticiella alkaliphila TaxID=2779529 RepID=UPI001C0D975D|nr:PqiC family protein [Verticiella sp. GG226]MBU4612952.1 membrane integrity-associated transporter subunit PqiC [Verticiella sp. GG226]
MAAATRCLLVCLPLVLAACGTPPRPNIHTLLAAPSPAAASATGDFAVQTMPINLPAQVDQPYLMLRTGGGALTPLYGERWAAPLADELQAAFSAALTRRLGVPDVGGVGVASGLPTWRVQTDVQRFELPTQGPAVLDATWRIRQDRGAALLCRSVVELAPDGEGVPALVQAQQQAVARLADAVALAIEAGGRRPQAVPGVTLANCSRTEATAAGAPG